MNWKTQVLQILRRREEQMEKFAFDPEMNGKSNMCVFCSSGTDYPHTERESPKHSYDHGHLKPCMLVELSMVIAEVDKLSEAKPEDWP